LGWGDVKLAALGGAVLGAQVSVLVFAVASLAAVIVSRFRGVDKNEPIAFAPYLAAAIGVAIPIGSLT
jgi:prepilin signal peptidase PulO-like enzyme (type II secretory pathway)